MARIKFKKGEQRKFLDLVIFNLNCISLRGILQFGVGGNYSRLKNYYTERRILSAELFDDLCFIAKIDKDKLNFEVLKDNWGQVLGGRQGKR